MTSPWIDVTKGLPEEMERVLAVYQCSTCGEENIALYFLGGCEWIPVFEDEEECNCRDVEVPRTITHWIALPELPERK